MPKVLFVCTGNSARSVMAEAFFREAVGDACEVLSAGFEPRPIHPMTVQVMNEVGIDLSNHQPRSLRDFLGRESLACVVFVCQEAEEQCPTVWPFTLARRSWPFDDPAAVTDTDAQKLARFRDIRDQIRSRASAWADEVRRTGELA